jgi:hypothetical protein
LAAAQPRKKTLRRVHSAAKTGNLRARLGKSWAMVLQQACSGGHLAEAGRPHRVRACAIDVMSLPSAQPAAPDSRIGGPAVALGCCAKTSDQDFNHDFVIGLS